MGRAARGGAERGRGRGEELRWTRRGGERSHAGCGGEEECVGGASTGERAGEIQPAAVARASAQPRSDPLPPRVTFGCWRAGEGASEQRPRRRRAGEGQLLPAEAALRA